MVPHYNIPHLLDRLLCTIPLREDLQVIVVDDCSTKNIEEYEQLKYKYPSVEWYSTGENGGGGKARNIGLKHAKGEYVLFADSDDFFLPNFNDVLDLYKVSNQYDIVFFNSISLYSKTLMPSDRGRNWQKKKKELGNEKKFEDYLKYLFGEPWCKLIKRSIIEENNINFEETPIHNDTYFSYMIGFYAKNIKIDERAIYCITTREASVSKTINSQNLIIRAEVFAKKNKFFKDNNIPYFDKLLFSAFYPIRKNRELKNIFYYTLQQNGICKYEFYRKLLNTYPLRIKNKIKFILKTAIEKM